MPASDSVVVFFVTGSLLYSLSSAFFVSIFHRLSLTPHDVWSVFFFLPNRRRRISIRVRQWQFFSRERERDRVRESDESATTTRRVIHRSVSIHFPSLFFVSLSLSLLLSWCFFVSVVDVVDHVAFSVPPTGIRATAPASATRAPWNAPKDRPPPQPPPPTSARRAKSRVSTPNRSSTI